ncbi:hypothetical protein EAI_00050, partial [Harpegnathos saltator]
ERYPNYPQKSHMTFYRMKKRFLQYGCVQPKRNRQSTIVNEENAADVIAYVSLNPHSSSRQISTESRISQTSVMRILHKYKFHPYHMSLYQNLYGNDFANRVNFCNWIRR